MPSSDPSPTTVSPTVTFTDLINIESDIIERIYHHLELRDRLSFAGTCKRLSQLHNQQHDLWNSVWLNAGKASSMTSSLLRTYRNVKLYFNDDQTEPTLRNVLAPIASTTAALRIRYYADKEEENARNSINFIAAVNETIPLFQHITSLDLGHNSRYFRRHELSFNTPNTNDAVITLTNLKQLRIGIALFTALHCGGSVDFSQSKKLESIDIPQLQGFEITPVDELNAMDALFSMIRQQKNLKSLILECDGASGLFDQPLVQVGQLDEFDIFEQRDGANVQQQENLLDFLESQKQLIPTINIWDSDPITPRMWRYIASSLDLPRDKQDIYNIDEIIPTISNYGCFLPTNQLRVIFQSTAIQQNLVTTHFVLTLTNETYHRHHHQDWLIGGICYKYPNLNSFWLDAEYGPMPNLSQLNSLSNLTALQISTFRRIGSSLRHVNISQLKVFQFAVSEGLMLHRDFVQLKSFLERHIRLNDVRILFQYRSMEENYNPNPHALQRFIDDMFDLLNFVIENLKELGKLEMIGLDLTNQPKFQSTLLMMEKHASVGFVLKLCSGTSSDEVRVKFVKSTDGIVNCGDVGYYENE